MKLLVIDGNSIINRAFYGIRTLSTKEGLFTNGIYGFLTTMAHEADAEKPDGIVAAFDLRAPTFRHLKYDGYKATRKGMPPELAMQMAPLKEVLTAMGVLCLEKETYEADDIIGTISKMCDENGDDCVILTGDKDDLQLISEHTTVNLVVTGNGTTPYTPKVFFEHYGFTPEKMIDLKALWGDTSDNIPGVPGIGEKTATELIQKYGTVEAIYDKIDSLDIKDSVKNKLVAGKDSAFLSYDLATIFREVPIGISLEEMKTKPCDYAKLYELYTKLEFRQFAEKIRSLAVEKATPTAEVKTVVAKSATSLVEVEDFVSSATRLALLFEKDTLFGYNEKTVLSLSPMEMAGDFEKAVLLLLENNLPKVMHDVKGILSAFSCHTLPEKTVQFDTMLAAYLLNPSASTYAVEGLLAELLGLTVSDSATAVSHLFALSVEQEKQLKEWKMEQLYREIELPLCFVLFEMEQKGVKLDVARLEKYGADLRACLTEYSNRIFAQAGEEFNINSPKQLGTILFEKLNLPGGKKSKTGAYKTDADVLSHLSRYPIVSDILAFRQVSKLLSTYVEGLSKVVNTEDSRIHTTFNQTVTVTGRISSAEPNLQNIPVRTELGRELRKMFLAKEGNLLLDADYSQIELRVLSALAEDETMKNAFITGEDIHSVTASQVFGVPQDMVTGELRRRAKAVNFGIVYGISAFSLADDIGSTQAEAKNYINAYFATYHKVKEYLDKLVEDAVANGFVTTALGRRRALPELKSSNFMMREFGKRAAMNTPIQGTAADIIKLAMVKVQNRLKSEGLQARLVLQIHDELIVECPVSEKEKASRILQEEMEHAYPLSVPLTAEVGVGKSWFDAK